MKNIFIILSLAFLAFSCSSNCCKKESTTTTINCSIDGMTCKGCETTIKSKLETVEGVTVSEIDHKTGKTVITVANSDVKTEQLCKMVEEAGYKCTLSPAGDSSAVEKPACNH